jgi:hypothetical protein
MMPGSVDAISLDYRPSHQAIPAAAPDAAKAARPVLVRVGADPGPTPMRKIANLTDGDAIARR